MHVCILYFAIFFPPYIQYFFMQEISQSVFTTETWKFYFTIQT